LTAPGTNAAMGTEALDDNKTKLMPKLRNNAKEMFIRPIGSPMRFGGEAKV